MPSRWFLRNVGSLSTYYTELHPRRWKASAVSLATRVEILLYQDRYYMTCISLQYSTSFIQEGNLQLDHCLCEEAASLDTLGRKSRLQDGSKSLCGHHLLGAHFNVVAISSVLIALAVSERHSGKHAAREPFSLSQTPYNLRSMYRTTKAVTMKCIVFSDDVSGNISPSWRAISARI
jgi:hypothetical protein